MCRRDLTANIRAHIQQLREAEEAEKEAVPTYGQTVRCHLACPSPWRPSVRRLNSLIVLDTVGTSWRRSVGRHWHGKFAKLADASSRRFTVTIEFAFSCGKLSSSSCYSRTAAKAC